MSDQICIHPATGTHGKGNWQAIGHYNGCHIAAFGFSPQDALDKAMKTYNDDLQYEQPDDEVDVFD